MFLSLGFHTAPCLPKGEALETYNDDATTRCPASFAQGKSEGIPQHKASEAADTHPSDGV